MSNRLLLAILTALTGVGVLLCLLVPLRENSNATNLTAHKIAAERLVEETDRQIADLKTTLGQTRQELLKTIQALDAAQQKLLQLGKDLARSEQTLNAYRGVPWLNGKADPKAPWTGEIYRIDEELKKLKEPKPPEEK